MNKVGDLRVWWIPQVPMQPFYWPVPDVKTGVLLMDVLAKYDAFQFENNIKPDYSNVGGIEQWSETAEDEGTSPGWEDWFDEETGEDDPFRWLEDQDGAACA